MNRLQLRDDSPCAPDNGDDFLHLRIASIFIILIGSLAGASFPVLAKRSSWLHVPKSVFDFAKYFGSGVIIATAFIHLLASGVQELGSPCINPAWQEYPYALALSLLSIFFIFIVEIIAFRWGTAKLAKLGLKHDAHGHEMGSHAAHGPELSHDRKDVEEVVKPDTHSDSIDSSKGFAQDGDALTQIIGVAILEFGVALHSVIIGLTLAVDPNFKILFVVIIFHQTFEGLGVGSRLAFMKLPSKYNWVPLVGALIYGITTPIGIAAGLGIRTTYNPNSGMSNIVAGVLDSLSSGILLYTGLVELLAHEFLFNKEMMEGSNGRLAYALGSMMLGCGLMALLGKWA
ncbi:ZIP zinc/iron transport family [Pluteus cervinus]|uniref:ZIP zinc/iron transport family n=1 Tax=Pluteus cervinus TaxID=181527 RepID=A0ACD3BA86_9AGAR|nr:ZIP zinc/iron transport family [Pluteus cervinus]